MIVNSSLSHIWGCTLMALAFFASLDISAAENSTPMLRSAVEALRDGETLSLPTATYRLSVKGAREIELAPSNNRTGLKSVAFPIFGKKNVTIDGNGSTFVCEFGVSPFASLSSQGVTLKNFTITMPYKPVVAFKVMEKNDKFFRIKLEKGCCQVRIKGDEIIIDAGERICSSKEGRLSMHPEKRQLTHIIMTPSSPGNKDEFPSPFCSVLPKAVGEDEIIFTYVPDSHKKCCALPYEVNERVNILLDQTRSTLAFFFQDSTDICLENVTLRRFPGMGLVAQRCENITVRGLTAAPCKNEDVSLTADIMRFINCGKSVRVEQCFCANSADDIINVHGNYMSVVSVSGNKAVLSLHHESHRGFFPYRAGDKVEFSDFYSHEILGSAKVVSLQANPTNAYSCTVVFDSSLPSFKKGTLVENVTLSPDVTLKGNKFFNYSHIRISGRGKILVENNRFEHCQGLIFMDLAGYWMESGRISDVTIRNNDFVNCNARGGNSFVTIGIENRRHDDANVPLIHGRVLFEGNRYSGIKANKYVAWGVREVIDRDKKMKRVLILGDSISDKCHVGCTKNYWGFLAENLFFTPYVYAVNGAQMLRLPGQLKAFAKDHKFAPDVVLAFAGTNDYNANIPLGEWYSVKDATVNRNGRKANVKKRSFNFDESTFRGRINILMKLIKEMYPNAKVLVVTPLHRGYAWFGDANVQPDESYSNERGLFIDDYASVIREAGGVWSVKVVDLFADSGILPNLRSQDPFIHNVNSDRLHPSTKGHKIVADAVELSVGKWLEPGE